MNLKIVDALFNKMLVIYGAEWVRKWEGMPMSEVKGAWADELRGMNLDQIKYGLEMLPERPPNLMQFKNLCRNAPPKYEQPQLPYRPIVNQEKRDALWAALNS